MRFTAKSSNRSQDTLGREYAGLGAAGRAAWGCGRDPVA